MGKTAIKGLTALIHEVMDEVKQEILEHERLAVPVTFKDFSNRKRYFPSLRQHFLSKEVLRLGGLIIADATSAGKTLVGWLTYHQLNKSSSHRNMRALVIGPHAAAESAWSQNELDSYSNRLKTPGQQVLRVRNIDDLSGLRDADFVVINDDKLGLKRKKDFNKNKYLQALLNLGKNYFDLVILDEGHREKNSKANKTQAFDKLVIEHNPRAYRIVLTATPQWGRPNDIGMLLHYVDPKAIPQPDIFDYTRDYDAACRVIRKYLRRVTREQLSQYVPIPKLIRKVHEIALNDKSRECYLNVWEKQNKFFKFIWGARNILVEEKIHYLEESRLVERIAREGYDGEGRRQVLIFTQMREKGRQLTKRLERIYTTKGFRVVRIDGNVSPGKRKKLAEQFRRGEAEIAVVTSRTMGVGAPLSTYTWTNLPVSIVSIDEEFAPGALDQKEGRALRIGQVGDVWYHRLLVRDEKLFQMMKKRVKSLGEKHHVFLSEAILKHFRGTTLDEDEERIITYKNSINEKMMNLERIDELQLLLANCDPSSKDFSLFSNLCIYSNLLNLIPTITPSHFATMIAGMWNGKGVDYLQRIANTPIQELYVDLYDSDYEYTASAHTARLLGKIISGLEKKICPFRKIADFGSGAAYVSRTLGRKMICIDFWENMLERGKEHCKKLARKHSALKGNQYLCRKMQDTGLKDKSQDLIISSYSLQYQIQGKDQRTGREKRELEDVALEVNRILPSGGIWLITLPESLAKGSYERFNKQLRHFGFEVADISGKYFTREAYAVEGDRMMKKSLQTVKFKSVYVTIARKVNDAQGYLDDPERIALYKPIYTTLQIGLKRKSAKKQFHEKWVREICTDFGRRYLGKMMHVEELVKACSF